MNKPGVSVTIVDHRKEVQKAMEAASARLMDRLGEAIAANAKAICPVGTVESTGKKGYLGGTLRDSITHRVSTPMIGGFSSLRVGSPVEYAAYVELGTGPYFEPPPSWEVFTTTKGSGVGHAYVKPRPFLRPAAEEHREEYLDIVKAVLKGENE